MFSNQIILFIVFNIIVFGMLALDLKVFHKKTHEVGIKEAAVWSGVWVSLALLFNAFVWLYYGHQKGLEFFTGYLIEESLSVDNLFVFILIFRYFAVPTLYHHRVLFWGILGALFMRGAFITSGIFLINKFHFVIYIFGAFLIITGIKMFWVKDKEIHPDRSLLLKVAKKIIPFTHHYDGNRFFSRQNGKVVATLLFMVLLVVETTDIIFALDSIPAVFAITTDPLIVYTSNIFAVLGLRALYFLLAGMMDRFEYLGTGLAFILTFVGIKMLISGFIKIPIMPALAVIAAILAISVVASLMKSKKTNCA